MTPEEHDKAVYLLGPWASSPTLHASCSQLIGCYSEVFLTGILCCQFVHYMQWYKDDIIRIKLIVFGLGLLSLLKSIQSFALIWIMLILTFTDLDGAILLNYTTWRLTFFRWQSGNPLMVAFIGLYVQAFFCHRLYAISKLWWVVIPVAAIMAFAFFSIALATFFITKGDGHKIGVWFAAHLGSVFTGDLLLSMSTVFFLLRSKKSVLPQTAGLFTALIRLTLESAAPAAVCTLLNLLFSQIYGSDRIISTAFNMILPKIYAMSMMWTLNKRRSIRAVHSSRTGTTSSHETSAPRSRFTRGNERQGDMELGAIGGVQVRTHMETVQHIDVSQVCDISKLLFY
ncbi:hypothetical protein C8J56DRAFT_775207 [Mycena floridula]|nr:hypothetical protein C8J56DRAFT_775207 [Mycena floridula]